MAHFRPELVAHFNLESLVLFVPEYLSGTLSFDSVVHFARIIHKTSILHSLDFFQIKQDSIKPWIMAYLVVYILTTVCVLEEFS